MSKYYIGGGLYGDSDYLEHKGREGQRKGFHLPDVWARLKAAGKDAGRRLDNALGRDEKEAYEEAKMQYQVHNQLFNSDMNGKIASERSDRDGKRTVTYAQDKKASEDFGFERRFWI